MAQQQVKNRPAQLVAMMDSGGVSSNFQIFAQRVFNCIDMAAATAKVELVLSSDVDKKVTVIYKVKQVMSIKTVLELVCGNKNSVDLASIRMCSSQTGEVQLSVRISSSPPSARARRFPNRVSDALLHLGWSKLDTDTGQDIQKYILNIDEKQPVPLWIVDTQPEFITLHADNVVELDLFHIKVLIERWPNITEISYGAYVPQDPNSAAPTAPQNAQVFVPRISFVFKRTHDKEGVIHDDDAADKIEAAGKRKREEDVGLFSWLFGKKNDEAEQVK